jgi:hypothetical protein
MQRASDGRFLCLNSIKLDRVCLLFIEQDY